MLLCSRLTRHTQRDDTRGDEGRTASHEAVVACKKSGFYRHLGRRQGAHARKKQKKRKTAWPNKATLRRRTMLRRCPRPASAPRARPSSASSTRRNEPQPTSTAFPSLLEPSPSGSSPEQRCGVRDSVGEASIGSLGSWRQSASHGDLTSMLCGIENWSLKEVNRRTNQLTLTTTTITRQPRIEPQYRLVRVRVGSKKSASHRHHHRRDLHQLAG